MTRTVLVAERDLASRRTIAAILEERGFHVVMVSGAERARNVLEDNPAIAGLVADATITTVENTLLVADLRQDARYRELPIIAVGSSARVGDVLRALDRGASRFVAKAALNEALGAEIDALLMV
jgi:CheY-like chemotaxis protein